MPNKTKSARTETGAREAKILLFDVESSPNIGYTWGVWEENVIEVIEARQIISVAWKWFGEKGISVKSLPDFPGYRKDPKNNKALIEHLHGLISRADIAVGHNIDKFDDKMANTDFIKHGMTPPPSHKTVDTLKIARKHFRFNSNKLNDLGVFLRLGQKVKHSGFVLWKACLAGDMKAWKLMRKYNAGDVALLEKVYLKFRPWMPNHPAIKPREITNKNPACPICKEKKMQMRGKRINRSGTIPRYQCQACGHWVDGILIRKEWRIK